MGVDLVDITAKRAALTPNRIAFEDAISGRTLTYAQLDDRCARAAAVLAALGVERGDRVAILCRNRIEFFEIMFACAKLGAILVPLNWRSPVAELVSVLADCAPKLMVFGAEDAETAGALRRDGLQVLALDHGAPASSPADAGVPWIWVRRRPRRGTPAFRTTSVSLRTPRRCKRIGGGRATRLGS
jgi:fatty-acyl-CoA synthase